MSPMPHSQVVRMLDVAIEHLREKQQRLVRSDRKSVADRSFAESMPCDSVIRRAAVGRGRLKRA